MQETGCAQPENTASWPRPAVAWFLVGVLVLLTTVVGASLNQFINALPGYQESLAAELSGLLNWLAGRGLTDQARVVLRQVALVLQVLLGQAEDVLVSQASGGVHAVDHNIRAVRREQAV